MRGLAYGVYRAVGCAQPLMNVIAYHAGREVGSLVRDAASPDEALRKAAGMLGLADRFTVTRDGDVMEVVEGCNACPKRVGGYEIEGTLCPVPGLLLGVAEQLLWCAYTASQRE